MERILIIYASNHGHTGKIAERLGSMLTERGPSVRVHEVGKADRLDPSPFEEVIVLASIHVSRHQAKMADWVKRNADILNQRTTAFLSVSLSAGSGTSEILAENREQARSFSQATGWEPDHLQIVAGCLQYPAYGFFARFTMKRLAKRQGLPLDTSRDHEYTDWEALEAFAADFVAGRSQPIDPPVPGPEVRPEG